MQNVRLWVAVAVLVAAGVVPCQSQEKKPAQYDADFYPLREGNQWTYKMTIGDAKEQKKEQKVVITAGKPEAYEFKTVKDKKEFSEIIVRFPLKVVSEAKELVEHVAVKDGVYRIALAGKDINPPLCFLKLPAKKGDSWKVDSKSENAPITGTFTCDQEKVKVPFGEFNTIRVSTPDLQLERDKMAIDYWFAQNVGLVKQRVRVGNNDVLLELEDFKAAK
jgi:hypothetical protein